VVVSNSGVVAVPVVVNSFARCAVAAASHFTTAGINTRARRFELRSTAPRISVNTRSSRPLPTISADSSSASTAGNGTERRSHVFGADHTAVAWCRLIEYHYASDVT
jgi:hypothetical protein